MSTDIEFESDLREGLTTLSASVVKSDDALQVILKRAEDQGNVALPLPHWFRGRRLVVVAVAVLLLMIGGARVLDSGSGDSAQQAGFVPVPDLFNSEIDGCGGGYSTSLDLDEVSHLQLQPAAGWTLTTQAARRDESREADTCRFGIVVLAEFTGEGRVADRVVTVRADAGPNYGPVTDICGVQEANVSCFTMTSGQSAVGFPLGEGYLVVWWEALRGQMMKVRGDLSLDDVAAVAEAVTMEDDGRIDVASIGALEGFTEFYRQRFAPTVSTDQVTWRGDYSNAQGETLSVDVTDPATEDPFAGIGGPFELRTVNGKEAVGFVDSPLLDEVLVGSEQVTGSVIIWTVDGTRIVLSSSLGLDDLNVIAESLTPS